jgi:hypothetical protein
LQIGCFKVLDRNYIIKPAISIRIIGKSKMQNWLQSVFQNVEWGDIIVAVFFGALGFVLKTVVDYIKTRVEKREEISIELQKQRLEIIQNEFLVTIQAFLDTREAIGRLFNQIAHMRNIPRDRKNGKYDRESYIERSFAYNMVKLIAALEIVNSTGLYIVVSDEVASGLSILRQQLRQILSDQGLFREYQTLLAKFVSSHEDSFNELFDRNNNKIPKEALQSLVEWTKKLVNEFEDAFVDSFYQKNHRLGKSLQEQGIEVPYQYDYNAGQISNLKLLGLEAELMKTISSIFVLVEQQYKLMLDSYRHKSQYLIGKAGYQPAEHGRRGILAV